MTRKLLLEGLGCANCAARIEEEVGKLKRVKKASVSFAERTLTLETDAADAVLDDIRRIVKKYEPDVIVRERIAGKTVKKTLVLERLCCANCATEIETGVRGLEGVRSARLDFVTKRLIMEIAPDADARAIVREASRLAVEAEPGISVIEEAEAVRAPEREDGGKRKARLVALGVGAALFLTAVVGGFPLWVGRALYIAAYALIGGEVVCRAVRSITRGRVFDENTLMTIATAGAFAIGEFPEAVAVMLFYQAGEYFQERAVDRSRRSIVGLMDIRPDCANLVAKGGLRRVAPQKVAVGDRIVVKPGERLPLDGRVIDGVSTLDTSALTGESLPRDAIPGSEVLSGSVNIGGVLTVEVTRDFGDSTVTRILELIGESGARKAKTESFITKFARYYTPAVVASAVALAFLPPLLVPGAALSDWVQRALVFLVVSCPCALVISIPLGFFGGIGGASRQGILIKGGNHLEALNRVDTVVFDKTGTLTKGVFEVINVTAESGREAGDVLETAAYAEAFSGHPIARSIQKAYGHTVDTGAVADYEEVIGQGVRATVNGRRVLAGNGRMMAAEGIAVPDSDAGRTMVHVAKDGSYIGRIAIADAPREDAQRAVEGLRAAGVKKLVMLTGDSEAVARAVGERLRLDAMYAGLLPHQKVDRLEEIMGESDGKVLFVGDGINDAPVLARADVGVAMGGIGSDAAIEAADVVLMRDEPFGLVDALRVAKRTRRIVWQNIVFALGVKALVLALGAGGLATMWEAVFADVGVALIAVLNAMRVLKPGRAA
jgi:Cd2+/Zn2+-exporting ATPase